jgi:hypothetical protein
MIKKKQNISINILAVVVLLFTVLLLSIGIGNAWFTSSQDRGIKISVKVSEYNVTLNQVIDGKNVEVYTYKKNEREEEKGNATKFITLSQMLMPEEDINLQFNLINNDNGAGVYLRYKLNVYACGVDEDTIVPINLNLGNDFIEDSGYYCYAEGVGNYIAFKKSDTITLCTSFAIPYSSFQAFDGGETVRMELIIECVDVGNSF